MDPVTLVVAALVVGATRGVGDAAASAVGDLYKQLKGLVARRFGGAAPAQAVLAEHEADPMGTQAALVEALTELAIPSDAAEVDLAHRLLELADPQGAAAGKYRVTVVGGQGVQVGDHNSQHNTFGP